MYYGVSLTTRTLHLRKGRQCRSFCKAKGSVAGTENLHYEDHGEHYINHWPVIKKWLKPGKIFRTTSELKHFGWIAIILFPILAFPKKRFSTSFHWRFRFPPKCLHLIYISKNVLEQLQLACFISIRGHEHRWDEITSSSLSSEGRRSICAVSWWLSTIGEARFNRGSYVTFP